MSSERRVREHNLKENGKLDLRNNSEKGYEIEVDHESIVSVSKESNTFERNYFIYNQNQVLNRALINPSSENVLRINHPSDLDWVDKSAYITESDSSLGLHILRSENIIEKANEKVKRSTEVNSDIVADVTKENIDFNETTKLTNDERIIYKSTSFHKTNENSSIEDNKSAISWKNSICLPVLSNTVTSDLEKIMNDCSNKIETEGIKGTVREFINDKFYQNENLNLTLTEDAGVSGIKYNGTVSSHLNVMTALMNDDNQTIADLLFDDIYAKEIAIQSSLHGKEREHHQSTSSSVQYDFCRTTISDEHFESNYSSLLHESGREHNTMETPEVYEKGQSNNQGIRSDYKSIENTDGSASTRLILTDLDNWLSDFDSPYESKAHPQNANPTMENTVQKKGEDFYDETNLSMSEPYGNKEGIVGSVESSPSNRLNRSIQSIPTVKNQCNSNSNVLDFDASLTENMLSDGKQDEMDLFRQRVEEASSLRHRPLSQSPPKFGYSAPSTTPLPTIVEIPDDHNIDDS